jgi:hypothetical protein
MRVEIEEENGVEIRKGVKMRKKLKKSENERDENETKIEE